MPTMRICLISREFPPDTGWGGIGTFVHDLALGLKEIGQEVEVISLSKDSTESVIDYKGVPIHRVAVDDSLDKYQMLLSVMPYSHSLLKALWALNTKFLELNTKKRFDVVEVPEMFGEGLFLSLSKTTPLVVRLYTPHFKFIDDKLHLIDDAFDHQFLALLEQITLLNADVVTSPSEDLGDYVSGAIGFRPEEMVVIRGLIDTNRFSPEGPKALPDDGHLKVMFVGRLEERKGVYQLVKAIPEVVKKSPSVKFYFVGNDTKTARGQKSVLAELQKELEKNGCSKHVVFTGAVPHASMPDYFRSADIFVLPSLYDNAPLTCLEAISSGTALVGTSAGGMKEYVVNGESGTIVAPQDVSALANALIELLNDDSKRKSYGEKARARAVALYDRKITAAKTVELYQYATANFDFKRGSALFRKDSESLLPRSEVLLKAFDKMIYDLLYQRSLAFRMSYWYHMFKDRPKLFTATAAVNATSWLSQRLGRDTLPPRLERIRELIEKQGNETYNRR
ncbi:MAG: glycosyltransferase family 4 protein [Candidatus Obscuribacterales bacterium]|nr:glycosyltransferase family 4 protein [Candidatus Obscuribacterales bacterium]